MVSTAFEKLISNRKGAIHIGANIGEERYWYLNNGFSDVIWIEPILSSYNQLLENIKEFPTHKAYNIGIYNETKQLPLHIASNDGVSSSILDLKLCKIYHPQISYIKDELVNFIRMDEFIKLNNIDITNFNMLNVDVQGVELEVIQSFGQLITNFDYILTEVNEAEIYKDCALIKDIDKYLNEFNFIRVETYMNEFKWGDAFYIKNK